MLKHIAGSQVYQNNIIPVYVVKVNISQFDQIVYYTIYMYYAYIYLFQSVYYIALLIN